MFERNLEEQKELQRSSRTVWAVTALLIFVIEAASSSRPAKLTGHVPGCKADRLFWGQDDFKPLNVPSVNSSVEMGNLEIHRGIVP